MKAKSLERRTVQMLTCDANRNILKNLVEKELNVKFRYIASEFPIITDHGYGFLDLVGIDDERKSIVLIECKLDASLLPKALKEVEHYQKSLRSYGLFQSKDLIGLYHTAIFEENLRSETAYDVRPLIVNRNSLLRHSGLSMAELFSRYRTFMINGVANAYQISPNALAETIPKNTVPVYLINRLKDNERKSFAGHLGLNQPLDFVEMPTRVIDAPLKLERDKTNYETMRRIENVKNSGRFSIQFHRHGHSRPMLFFEVDDKFSACFIHTGRHQLRLNGYYESAKVMTGTGRIFGLFQIENGRYSVEKSKGNKITLEIHGRRCHGEIKLNFLDMIYIDDYLALSFSKQTTLENH